MGVPDSVPWVVVFYTLGIWSFVQAVVAAIVVRSSIVLADLVPQLLVTVGALFVALASATQYFDDASQSSDVSEPVPDETEDSPE